MAKHQDLGWAWKPDGQTVQYLQTKRWDKKLKRKIKARKRKKKKPLSKRERLLYAPGHVFYWSKAWRRLRWQVLAKYGYRCMLCGEVDTEIHVDHIKPRSKAPHLSLTFDNLQVLCKECNMQKSNRHSKDYREKAAAEEIDRETYLAMKKRMGW